MSSTQVYSHGDCKQNNYSNNKSFTHCVHTVSHFTISTHYSLLKVLVYTADTPSKKKKQQKKTKQTSTCCPNLLLALTSHQTELDTEMR